LKIVCGDSVERTAALLVARGKEKPTFGMYHATLSFCLCTSHTPCLCLVNFGHRCSLRVLGTRPRFVVLLYCLSEYPETFELQAGRLKVVVVVVIIIIIIIIIIMVVVVVVVVLSRSRIKLGRGLSLFR
jgi:hypothetical protein